MNFYFVPIFVFLTLMSNKNEQQPNEDELVAVLFMLMSDNRIHYKFKHRQTATKANKFE